MYTYVAPHLIRKILCQYARLVIKRNLTIWLSTAYLYLGEYFQDFVSRSLIFFWYFPDFFSRSPVTSGSDARSPNPTISFFYCWICKLKHVSPTTFGFLRSFRIIFHIVTTILSQILKGQCLEILLPSHHNSLPDPKGTVSRDSFTQSPQFSPRS